MSTAVELVDPLEALLYGPRPDVLRIGLVIPGSGVLGLTGPSALDAAVLAASEVNTSAGGHQRRVELVVVDSGGVRRAVADAVAQLARAEAVNAFVGLHTSHTLVAVEQALDGSVPYVFASGYEATRSIPGVYCPGETPAEFVGGLTRVGSDRGITSWAILGTDYVWPRAARVVERAAIDAAGAQVVLDELVPMGFGTQDGKNAVDLLHTSSCQGVILNMSGLDLVRMLEAIRTRGLDNLVRISNCLEENSLYALGGDTSGNLYSGLHSFESLRSPAREALDERRRSLFGNVSPVLNSWSVQCYDAVKLLADLDRHDALSSQALDEDNALGDVPVSVRPRIGGVVTPPAYDQHLAVAEGMSFEVL